MPRIRGPGVSGFIRVQRQTAHPRPAAIGLRSIGSHLPQAPAMHLARCARHRGRRPSMRLHVDAKESTASSHVSPHTSVTDGPPIPPKPSGNRSPAGPKTGRRSSQKKNYRNSPRSQCRFLRGLACNSWKCLPATAVLHLGSTIRFFRNPSMEKVKFERWVAFPVQRSAYPAPEHLRWPVLCPQPC